MDNRTTPLAEGVWAVEVSLLTNALVLANDGRSDAEGLTVVDTGTASGGPRLVRSIRMLGFDPRAVGDVVLTHWHRDHAGSAQRFATSSAAPRVWCSTGELPLVNGTQAPPGHRLRRLQGPAAAVPHARGLADAQNLTTVAGGLRIIPAAGHTPGHIAVHLPARGVLHAGDALFNVLVLRPCPPLLSSDASSQPATLRRLAALQFNVLSLGHGPPVTRNARARLADFADAASA